MERASPNERFHASGGAASSDIEQVTTSFALVRTSPMPPPDAKLPGVVRQRGTLCRYFRLTLTSVYFDRFAKFSADF